MENTSENKAKFFYQYWLQRVLIRDVNNPIYDDKVYLSHLTIKQPFLTTGSLELIPLSSISDEDVRKVFPEYPYGLDRSEIHVDVENKDYHIKIWLGVSCKTKFFSLSDIQYLISKGYALPWMGLSVEKQIEYGWVKL